MRAALASLLLAASGGGCHLVFGVDADGADAGPPTDVADDAHAGEPRVRVPVLFSGDVTVPPPYLLEGAGFAGGVASASLPFVVEGLAATDGVQIALPDLLTSTGWSVCGVTLAAGSHDLRALAQAPPCRDGGTSLGLTISVPVSPALGRVDSVSPIVIEVRGAQTDELRIDLVMLDELDAATGMAREGLYSTIVLGDATPAKGGSAFSLRATSDATVRGRLDLTGGDGGVGATVGCNGGTCAGGAPGAGGAAGIASNCATPPCSMVDPLDGAGPGTCIPGCVARANHGGGGGGNAGTGEPGRIATCGAVGGPAGGAATTDAFVEKVGGGGGGGPGGNLSEDGLIHGGGGGGGGGAIAIDALGDVRFVATGAIDARGGRGGNGATKTCSNSAQSSGEGGGGAGGTIRLRGRTVVADAGSVGQLLDVRGRRFTGSVNGALGGAGRVRIDGAVVDPMLPATGGIRGPDFDLPAPVAPGMRLELVVRARSAAAAGELVYGARGVDATSYTVQVESVSGSGDTARTVSITLAPGLNEICVFAVGPSGLGVDEVSDALKRCVWVARVD